MAAIYTTRHPSTHVQSRLGTSPLRWTRAVEISHGTTPFHRVVCGEIMHFGRSSAELPPLGGYMLQFSVIRV
jgi:hypothetical protein